MMTTRRNAPRKRGVLLALVAVAVSGLVLAGARLVAYPAFVGAPDHLWVVVTRIESPTGRHTVIFDRQVKGEVAGKVYAQLVAGGRIPDGAITHCPASPLAPYYHYDLTFWHAGVQTGVAHSDDQGCRLIELEALGGGRDVYSWYAPDGVSLWETPSARGCSRAHLSKGWERISQPCRAPSQVLPADRV